MDQPTKSCIAAQHETRVYKIKQHQFQAKLGLYLWYMIYRCRF
jgi:hypothetical protein